MSQGASDHGAPRHSLRAFPRGSVIRDLRCIRCDYNLRGLERSSRCPECATPIKTSLHRAPAVERTFEQAYDGANTYARSQLACAGVGVLPLMMAGGGLLLLGFVAGVVAYLGCLMRVVALFQMRHLFHPGNTPVTNAFRRAMLATLLEAGLGGVYILARSMGWTHVFSDQVARYVVVTATAAWMSSAALSMLAGTLLADAVARQHMVWLDSARKAQLLTLSALTLSIANLAMLLVPALSSQPADPRGAILKLLWGLGALLWAGAAWGIAQHTTGIADALAHTPAPEPPAPLPATGPRMPAHTSAEEQAAARKLLSDDSPIPMD